LVNFNDVIQGFPGHSIFRLLKGQSHTLHDVTILSNLTLSQYFQPFITLYFGNRDLHFTVQPVTIICQGFNSFRNAQRWGPHISTEEENKWGAPTGIIDHTNFINGGRHNCQGGQTETLAGQHMAEMINGRKQMQPLIPREKFHPRGKSRGKISAPNHTGAARPRGTI